MTVSQDFPITRRPFRGDPRPGSPIGIWASHSGVLGDATGGFLRNIVRFQQILSPATSLLFSLDELVIGTNFNTLGNTLAGLMEVLGMDLLPQNGSTGAQLTIYPFTLIPFGAQRIGNGLDINSIRLPLYLGQPIKLASSRLLFEIANEVAQILSIKAGGYYWEAASINTPGGPRRPIDGLYSQV